MLTRTKDQKLSAYCLLSIATTILLAGSGSAECTKTTQNSGDPAQQSVDLSPGIIVRTDPPVAFIMAPPGGVEAVDCVTGKTLWATTEVAKPLAIVGSSLFLQKPTAGRRGVLPIAKIDLAAGEEAVDVAEIALPKTVAALIDQGPGASFSTRAWKENGNLVVAWRYLEQPFTGSAPPPGSAPLLHQAEGAARLDLESGTVEQLSEAPPRPSPPLPARLQHLFDSGELVDPVVRVGPVMATIDDDRAPEGRLRVVLRRWNAETGTALEDTTLSNTRPLARLVSADDQHVLLTSHADSTSWDRYLWSVYSLASGELIGEMRYHRMTRRSRASTVQNQPSPQIP
jgi:hypothetical protein